MPKALNIYIITNYTYASIRLPSPEGALVTQRPPKKAEKRAEMTP